MLRVGNSGGGRPVALDPLSGSLGRWILVYQGGSNAYIFGKVAAGFDQVRIDCDKGPTIEAITVDCADYLPYNHYVGEVVSRVTRVSATGPDGQTATIEQGL
jgi:hypothetical protein